MDKSKRKVSEAREILDAIGQDSERKAKKWVIYFEELAERQELEKNQIREEKLQKQRRKKSEYYQLCASMLHDLVIKLERPIPGFSVSVKFSGNGIHVDLVDPWGRHFKRGIKPCGTPKYDIPAIMTLLGSTEDTMWKIADEKVTAKGVYLP